MTRPPWLRAMENGSIGEARTKAILLDRFWILERSVDIDGADLLIQPRDYGVSFADPRPPRLGMIQCKYYQNEKTTQYVHRHYVVDDKGEPRRQFYAFCHTGTGDDSRLFVLSAGVIARNFADALVSSDESVKYRLSGREVFDAAYEVSSRSGLLDRIAHDLFLVSYEQNFRFVTQLVGVPGGDEREIEQEYIEPIPGEFGSIPREFREFKQRVTGACYELENVLHELWSAVYSTDPIASAERVLKVNRLHGQAIGIGDLGGSDLGAEAELHLEIVRELRERGLLDAFKLLQARCYNFTTGALENAVKQSSPHRARLGILVEYPGERFDNPSLSTRIIAASEIAEARDHPQNLPERFPMVFSARVGRIELSVDLEELSPSSSTRSSRAESVSSLSGEVRDNLGMEVLRLHLGQDRRGTHYWGRR